VSTKLKGDIAEQAVVLYALKRGWGVSVPVGDRMPYDLILDVAGNLVRVQVKSAWKDERSGNYCVDSRRAQTNRKVYKYSKYADNDFDFAVIYLEDLDVFYVMPSEVFNSYRGGISFVECDRRQRKPRSAQYREAWHLLTREWFVPLVA
jgi:hypothetical protein